MLNFAGWQKFLIAAVCLFGVIFATPNVFYETADEAARARADIAAERYGGADQPTLEELQAVADEWPSWMPPGVVNLGLDLRGGAHLLMRVKVEDLVKERMESLVARDGELRPALKDAGVTRYTNIRATDTTVSVRITDAADLDKAVEALEGLRTQIGNFITGTTGWDLQVERGDDQTLTISYTEEGMADLKDRTVATSLEIIRNRIDQAGTREPSIQRQGDDRVLVQVPGIGSAEELKSLIGSTAKLTFHLVERIGSPGETVGPDELLLPGTRDGEFYVVEKAPRLTGDMLDDASAGFHPQNGTPIVNFRFNSKGGAIFGNMTLQNHNRLFAIVLDEVVISAPQIDEPIVGGSGFIHGSFTVESAKELGILLRSGALPAEMEFLQESTVGPDLGADAVAAGEIASIVGFLGVIVFMVVAYGRFGVFASVALTINLILIIGIMSALGATLTLPGIAGIVLTIGMAVDANVLIFERIREELKTAKGPARAIERGYEAAYSAIFDANITTFIAALILFSVGSGPVKGFAVTLGIGLVTSVFSAVMLTRFIVATWFHRAKPKVLEIKGLRMVPTDTHIPFMSWRKITIALSCLLLAGSVALVGVKGLNFGIDFVGGTLVEVQTPGTADVPKIRDVVDNLDLGDVAVQRFGGENDVLVRIEQQADPTAPVAQIVGDALKAEFEGLEIRRVEDVGPEVSGELLMAGILALVLAVGAIVVYIWLRFEWQFGVGAVVALLHDVLMTVGVFSLLSIEFNLSVIAALLTIVGYSINDTVVIFDRVRENLRKYKQMELTELLDLSVNETLARTVMTSLTTILALGALTVFGPAVIQGFTTAMIIGIIIGTYSTVFVAAIFLIYFKVKRDWSSPDEDKKKAAGVQFGGAQV